MVYIVHMENVTPVTPEQKQPVVKTLALAGLVGIIIFAHHFSKCTVFGSHGWQLKI